MDEEEQGSVRFTIPSQAPAAEVLTDRLLALRPLGTVPYEAGDGREREATECYVVEVRADDGDSKTYIDLGRQPVPWDQPRRELSKATAAAPWVLGVIVKRNVAYFLNPPRPADVRRAQVALTDFLSDRRADREAREARAAAEAARQAEQDAAATPAKPRSRTAKSR